MINKYELQIWNLLDGDQLFRIDHYQLNENSIVFDVGAYKGNFAEAIIKKFNCYAYCFEPIKEYYDILVEKFKDNIKIRIYNYGFSKKFESRIFGKSEESSSYYLKNKNEENVQLVPLSNFIKDSEIKKIDLLKLNVEGMEYLIFEDIFENNMIDQIENIQVQWHKIYDTINILRANIMEKLNKTHSMTYGYNWIWENWKLKSTINEEFYKYLINQKYFRKAFLLLKKLLKQKENNYKTMGALYLEIENLKLKYNLIEATKNTEIDNWKNKYNSIEATKNTEIADLKQKYNKLEATKNIEIADLKQQINILKINLRNK